MHKIKSVFSYLIIGFLLIYISLTFFPEEMNDAIGFRTFIVLSNSMEPVLNQNDLIIMHEIKESEIKVGDIISFNVYIPELGKDAYVTHYIGDIKETDSGKVYYTNGSFQEDGEYDEWKDKDNQPYDITYQDIKGKYVFKIPYVGFVQSAFRNNVILSLVIANGFVLYILWEYIKEKNDEDNI